MCLRHTTLEVQSNAEDVEVGSLTDACLVGTLVAVHGAGCLFDLGLELVLQDLHALGLGASADFNLSGDFGGH